MRTPYIIGNWKMNNGLEKTVDFFDVAYKKYENHHLLDVGIAVQAPLIPIIRDDYEDIEILLGAQNCCDEIEGAYTGEVSVELLDDFAVDFCIIGHSERRQYYNETNEAVNKKAKLLLDRFIEPVICVGETLEEYEANKTKEVIEKQIEICCNDLDIIECTIAYEPVWAIGTGKSATAEIAQEVCHLIREKLRVMYGDDADEVIIIYGGSVNIDNIKKLLPMDDIDGVLVGGASLDVNDFLEMVEYAQDNI